MSGAEVSRAWRSGHPEQVAAENRRRRAAKQEWERENYKGACERCGAPTAKRRVTRCKPCESSDRAHGCALRWDRIRDLWNDGALMREIAAEVGRSIGSLSYEIGEMRAAGIVGKRYAR